MLAQDVVGAVDVVRDIHCRQVTGRHPSAPASAFLVRIDHSLCCRLRPVENNSFVTSQMQNVLCFFGWLGSKVVFLNIHLRKPSLVSKERKKDVVTTRFLLGFLNCNRDVWVL